MATRQDTTKTPSNWTGLKDRPATNYYLSKKICAQGGRSEDGTGPFQINLAQIPAVTIQKIAVALSWNLWPDAAPQPGAAAKKAKTVDKGSKNRVPTPLLSAPLKKGAILAGCRRSQ
jgi:hypothetical protein